MVWKLFSSIIFLICFCSSNILFAQQYDIHSDNCYFITDSLYREGLVSKLENALKQSNVSSVAKMYNDYKNNAKSKISFSNFPKEYKEEISPENIFARTKKSVFLVGIYSKNKSGNWYADIMASAYAISTDGICLTNFHVVKNIVKNSTYAKNDSTYYFVETADRKVYFFQNILSYDETNDVAMFQLAHNNESFDAIPIGKLAPVGSSVFCISNPEDNYYFFTTGIVARNYIRPSETESGKSKYIMGITADYSAGSSGSPIVDNRGNLVGMVSSTHGVYSGVNNHGSLQMVLKNAVPLNAIKAIF